jgi:large subunit ribosomal protein L21
VYAIVETGGKQYRVAEGETVDVEKLPAPVGEAITLDRVLLVAGDDGLHVGQPLVEGAQVRATVVNHDRGRKIIVFKYQAKQRYRRKTGHRQAFTRLLIDDIVTEKDEEEERQNVEASERSDELEA